MVKLDLVATGRRLVDLIEAANASKGAVEVTGALDDFKAALAAAPIHRYVCIACGLLNDVDAWPLGETHECRQEEVKRLARRQLAGQDLVKSWASFLQKIPRPMDFRWN